MIVRYNKLKELSVDDIQQIIRYCRDNDNLFMLVIDHNDINSRYDETKYESLNSYITTHGSRKLYELVLASDAITFEDREGNFTEIKSRYHRTDVKLVEEEVVTIKKVARCV